MIEFDRKYPGVPADHVLKARLDQKLEGLYQLQRIIKASDVLNAGTVIL